MTLGPAPPLLTVRSAAARLGVSRKWIYRLARRGELAALKISPRNTRITADSIERFMLKARRAYDFDSALAGDRSDSE